MIGVLLALIVALTVLAGPATAYMQATAAQLLSPATYVEAVMNPARNPAHTVQGGH